MYRTFALICGLLFILSCGASPSQNLNNDFDAQSIEKILTAGEEGSDVPQTDEVITLEGMAPWNGIWLNNPVTYSTYCLVDGLRSSDCECFASRRKLNNPGYYTYPLTTITNDRYSALEDFVNLLPGGEYEVLFNCLHNGNSSGPIRSNFFSSGFIAYSHMDIEMTWPTENTVTKFPDNKMDFQCLIHGEPSPCECEAYIYDTNDPNYLIHLNNSDFYDEDSRKKALVNLTHSTNFKLELTCQHEWWQGIKTTLFTKIFRPIMINIEPPEDYVLGSGEYNYAMSLTLKEITQFGGNLVPVENAVCKSSMRTHHVIFHNLKTYIDDLPEVANGVFYKIKSRANMGYDYIAGFYWRIECRQGTGIAFSPIRIIAQNQ